MLDGLTVLVTGASLGIGRHVSIVLAGHGADVVLGARSDGIYEIEELNGGERIDVNLFEVVLAWMGYWITHYSGTARSPSGRARGSPVSRPTRCSTRPTTRCSTCAW